MRLLRFFLTGILLLQGCDSPTIQDQKQEPKTLPQDAPTIQTDRVKVGLLLPLSGDHEVLGKQLLNAAQLALFSFPDHKIELLPKDTAADPATALDQGKELINEGVQLILGPLFAKEIEGLKAPAMAATTPILSFTNDIQKAGQGVFVFGFSPDTQTQSMLNFALKKGYKYFAALLPLNPFGKRMGEIVEKFGKDNALPSPTLLYAEPGSRAWEFELEKLKTIKTQVLFIPEGGAHIIEIAAYMKETGLSMRLLGSGQWDDPLITTSPLMVGAWYPGNKGRRDWFNKTYEDTFGETPQRLSSLAFDMVSLAIILSQDQTQRRPFTYNTLVRPQGFKGVEGFFKIEANGKTQRQLSIFQIQANGIREIGVIEE